MLSLKRFLFFLFFVSALAILIYAASLTPSVVTINSSFGTNSTNDNLSLYWTVSGDSTSSVIDWRLNGTSIAVLNMPFEGGSNSTWTKDYSMYGLEALVNGATWNSTGGFDGGGAYQFDGVDDEINITSSVLNITYNITIAGWFYLNGDPNQTAANDYRVILGKPELNSYAIRMEQFSGFVPSIYNGSGRCDAIATGQTSKNYVNKWAFVAFTYNSQSGKLTNYINDTNKTVSCGAGINITPHSSPLSLSGITNVPGGGYRRWNGSIDNLMIFNRILSAEEILALYNNRTDLFISNDTNVGDLWSACITPFNATDAGSAVCSENITILNNGRPILTALVLNSTLGTNLTSENLTVYNLTAVFDVDGDSTSLKLKWFNNSVVVSGLENQTMVTAGNTTKGDSWVVEVWPYDGSAYGSAVNTTNLTILNDVPNFVSVRISPTIAYTNDTLLGYCNFSDFDFDNVTYNFSLFNKGVLNSSGVFENFTVCYQETANVTATCSAGVINFTGNYTNNLAEGNSTALMDGDWSTRFEAFGEGLDENKHVAFNYVKPSNSVNASWEIKDSTGQYNLSIPSACFDPVLQLRINSSKPINYNYTYECYNGAAWVILKYYETASLIDFYEEAINWGFADLAPNVEVNVANISASTTLKGDNWTLSCSVFDGTSSSSWYNSTALYISNYPPNISLSNLILNSTLGTNKTSENLTVYNLTAASDVDGDLTKLIYDWRLNTTSIAVLNMPFEGGSNSTYTKDYSSFNMNAVGKNSPLWNSSGGFDGRGAYTFNNKPQVTLNYSWAYLNVSNSNFRAFYNSQWTISGFFKTAQSSSLVSYWLSMNVTDLGVFPALTGYTCVNNPGVSATGKSVFIWSNSSAEQPVFCSIANFAVNRWYHAAVTKSGSQITFYIDGIKQGNTVTVSNYGDMTSDKLILGLRSNGFWGWNGSIDEVMIFNRSLSPEEIVQLNNSRFDVLVSNETVHGDIWMAEVTPNDGSVDGAPANTSSLIINNTLPTYTYANITPTTVYTNSTLQANVTISDDADNDLVDIVFNWFKNALSYFVDNKFDFGRGSTVNSTLTGGNFSKGDNITVQITVGDGWGNNTAFNTSNISILNTIPQQGTPILNSTLGTNKTSENLTVYNVSTYDVDGDSVKNIINWRLNGSSLAYLLLPFENNDWFTSSFTMDYSDRAFNFTNMGAIWNATGGFDGKGAYQFDDGNTTTDPSYLNYSAVGNFNFTQQMTVMAWVYAKSTTTAQYDTIAESHNNWVFGLLYGKARLILVDTVDSSYHNPIDSPTVLNNNTWYHIVGVVDDAVTRKGRLFVNGVLVNSSFGGTHAGWKDIGTNGFAIGSRPIADNRQGFNGTIDDFRIYPYNLSTEQILLIYNNYSNIIVSNETVRGQNWSVCITTNDGAIDGSEVCTENLTIENSLPTQGTPILNSTSGTNKTSENLTVYNVSDDDLDKDRIRNIYVWYLNSSPLYSAYMPFEGGSNSTWTKDYSGNHNDGIVDGATWNATGGFDGRGAYEFFENDAINFTTSNDLYHTNNFTYAAWVKSEGKTGIIINQRFKATLGVTQSGGIPYIYFNFYNGTNYVGSVGTTSTSLITLEKWYFAAVTKSSENGVKLYINGTLVSSDTSASAKSNTGALTTTNIGSELQTSYLNGTLDEVMIIPGVLSPEQILELYKNNTNILVSNETVRGDVWSAEVTPNDGSGDGAPANTTNLTILNTAPTQGTPILNSTLGTNKTSENLTIYNVSTYDVDSDVVKNVVDWRLNGTSIAILNMPFEGGSNSTYTKDYSNRNNDGIVKGAAWNGTGGHDDRGAYQFDGTNDLINISDSASFDIKNITVSAWVKGTIGSGFRVILIRYTPHVTWDLTTSNGVLKWYVSSNGITWDLVNSIGTKPINDDKWHHVVGVYDGTQGYVYVDGVLNATGGIAGNIYTSGSSPVQIGALTASSQQFNGSIDEVMIFNRSLSPEEIVQLNNSRLDVLVSNETVHGDVWSAEVTPNDGFADGAPANTSSLIINNTLPTYTYANITPTTAYTNTTLQVNVTITDDADNDLVDVVFNWFKNAVSWFVDNFFDFGRGSIVNSTLTGGNFSKGDNIAVQITVGDGWGNNTAFNTSSVTILNTIPQQGIPLINNTDPLGLNRTIFNLTVANVSTYDVDGDNVKNIINWYENETSLTLLNMPFEGGSNDTWTKDYSGYSNNGAVINGVWSNSSGFDGKGAYVFNGSGFINISSVNVTAMIGHFSFSARVIAYSLPGAIFSQYNSPLERAGMDWNTGGFGIRFNTNTSNTGASKSGVTTTGVWHHVVGVDNGSMTLYIDGVVQTGIQPPYTATSQQNQLLIGNDAGTKFLNGSIDDVHIFNYSLSYEQVIALYQNQTNVLVANETTVNDVYKACITPNDGQADGNLSCSLNLTVRSKCTRGLGQTDVGVGYDCNTLQLCYVAINGSKLTGDYCNLKDASSDYSLLADQYAEFNSTSGKGVVHAGVANVDIDCNGSTINNTDAPFNFGVGIDADNVSVKNCIIYQGGRGIEVDNAHKNITIFNNTVHMGTGVSGSVAIELRNSSDNNTKILNNFVTGAINGIIRTHGANYNITIAHNKIGAIGYTSSNGIICGGGFTNVSYNNLTDVGSGSSSAMIEIRGNDTIVFGNFINGSSSSSGRGLVFGVDSYFGINITNNSFVNFGDSQRKGIETLFNVSNIIIENNSFVNNTVHLKVNFSNSIIKNNFFNVSTDVGVYLFGVEKNVTILNNTFSENGNMNYSSNSRINISIIIEGNNNSLRNNTFINLISINESNEVYVSGSNNSFMNNEFLTYSYLTPINDSGLNNSFCDNDSIGNFYEKSIGNRPTGDCGLPVFVNNISTGFFDKRVINWSRSDSAAEDYYDIFSVTAAGVKKLLAENLTDLNFTLNGLNFTSGTYYNISVIAFVKDRYNATTVSMPSFMFVAPLPPSGGGGGGGAGCAAGFFKNEFGDCLPIEEEIVETPVEEINLVEPSFWATFGAYFDKFVNWFVRTGSALMPSHPKIGLFIFSLFWLVVLIMLSVARDKAVKKGKTYLAKRKEEQNDNKLYK